MLIDLAPPSVDSYVRPFVQSINSSGHVTGLYRPAGTNRAFLYRDGATIDLGALGGSSSIGYAINGSGEVAGNWTSDSGLRAFVYTDGRMVDLDLGAFGAVETTAVDINSAGQVVGSYSVPAGPLGPDARGFLATPISLLLSRLLDSAAGAGPGSSLASTVRQAIRRYEDSNRHGTCAVLRAFGQEVRAQSGKRQLARETADRLRDAARAIEGALGC